MARLQVLMPMGGLGSRFVKDGYTTPKPLIEVDGVPMFMRALQSFSSIDDIDYIFVIRQEHNEKYDLANQIRARLPQAKIHLLGYDTGGAVETCLVAKNSIDLSTPITIADCDIYFESGVYFNKIDQVQATGKPDGMLLTFESDDPRYSYVKLDESGKAIQTTEKVVISNNAILGGYFFRSGQLFLELAEAFTSQPLPATIKEYFMSHLFNILLERGGTIEVANIDAMHIFGTPEELNAYLARSKN